MKRMLPFLLALIVAMSLASCKASQQPKSEILKAWTGDFSEETLTKTIKKYKRNYQPIVAEGEDTISEVSFETDFEVSSCSVSRLSTVDDSDINVERKGYIDLYIPAKCEGKKITISTQWWYRENDTWVKDYPIWSYLVRVEDAEGTAHYYYFRVNYEAP